MSCATLNSNAVQLLVTVANLPEGFCPASMQELANAIGERMIVTPNTEFNTFAIGSTAPSSNVGPWLKDCERWYVYNDATASYVPIYKGGFDTMQYLTTSGNFIVPAGIFKLQIEAFGGGGGGAILSAPAAGGGGGGGAYGCSIVTVTPGQIIPYVIGAGGAGGSPGTAGGNTTILAGTAGGGGGATTYLNAGVSGVATGFDINLSGQPGMASANVGANTNGGCNGGDAGGWGGKGGVIRATASATGRDGLAPGGGGSGGGASGAVETIGNGAAGAIKIMY